MTQHEDEDEYDDRDASTGRTVAEASEKQLAALRALGDAAAALVAANPRGGGDPLMRMLKSSGAWVYGQDSVQVDENSIWAINPFGIQHGSVAWNADPKATIRKLGEIMTPITSPKPNPNTFSDVGGNWTDQLSMSMRCVAGEDEGVQVNFKTNALGGIEAILDIVAKIGERARSGTREIVPIVQLSHTTYQHPSYGKIYKPVLKIVRWTTMDDGGQAPATPPDKPLELAGNVGVPVRRRRSA
jgi:hypothetical protein